LAFLSIFSPTLSLLVALVVELVFVEVCLEVCVVVSSYLVDESCFVVELELCSALCVVWVELSALVDSDLVAVVALLACECVCSSLAVDLWCDEVVVDSGAAVSVPVDGPSLVVLPLPVDSQSGIQHWMSISPGQGQSGQVRAAANRANPTYKRSSGMEYASITSIMRLAPAYAFAAIHLTFDLHPALHLIVI
jgi:hypothetical protein